MTAEERKAQVETVTKRYKQIARLMLAHDIPIDETTRMAMSHLAVTLSMTRMSAAKFVAYMAMIWEINERAVRKEALQAFSEVLAEEILLTMTVDGIEH